MKNTCSSIIGEKYNSFFKIKHEASFCAILGKVM